MSEFHREDRYTVIKHTDIGRIPHKAQLSARRNLRSIHEELFKAGAPARSFVVVESDWPEYNFVWLMLEHRMAGYPVPDFNVVKCAADVAVAESRLAALREELAELAELKSYATIPLRERCTERKDLQQRNGEDFDLPVTTMAKIDDALNKATDSVHRRDDQAFNLKQLMVRAANALHLEADNTSWFEIVGELEKALNKPEEAKS